MDVNEIITELMAIANFAKDIHYTCKGDAAYSKHLFADLLHDDIDTFIDELKENSILGQHQLPLHSKVYLERAAEKVPDIKESDLDNFKAIDKLVSDLRDGLTKFEARTRGEGSLIDSIGEHLDKCCGLLFLQIRKGSAIDESVEHDHDAATEKEVDRKEFKQVTPKVTPDQKLSLKYDEENTLVAESILNSLSEKLGL